MAGPAAKLLKLTDWFSLPATNSLKKCVIRLHHFFPFLGLRDLDLALQSGHIGAFLCIAWWQDAHCCNRIHRNYKIWNQFHLSLLFTNKRLVFLVSVFGALFACTDNLYLMKVKHAFQKRKLLHNPCHLLFCWNQKGLKKHTDNVRGGLF